MSFIQLKYVLYITSKYEIEKKTITFFKHLPTSTSSFASLGIIYEYVHNKYGGGGGGGGGGVMNNNETELGKKTMWTTHKPAGMAA